MLNVCDDELTQSNDRQGRYSGARTVRKRRMNGSEVAHSDDDSGAVEPSTSTAMECLQV
jgi:hypothetical protein